MPSKTFVGMWRVGKFMRRTAMRLVMAALILIGALSANGATAQNSGQPAARSIRAWARCDGVHDDRDGVAKAFAAAAGGAFVLQVDCPVFIHVGLDIAKPVFIDSDTTVRFSGQGLFILDNTLIPSFVIAGSRNVAFTGARVEYNASLPVDMTTGYYVENGRRVTAGGSDPIGGAFNDKTLRAWMSAHRGVVYGSGAHPDWAGPSDLCALFYITGASSNLSMTDMKLFVPPGAGADRFIPVAFALVLGLNSNQTIVGAPPETPQYYSVPSHVTFRDIDLDGYDMGWQAAVQGFAVSHVRAHRYADLQDAKGENIGGHSLVGGKMIGWFAPPHLFYINFNHNWDRGLYTRDVGVSDVIDYGNRVGQPRDTPAKCCEGNALSLKVGGIGVRVDNYRSDRPDGFLDLFGAEDLVLSDVQASYDSAFLHDLFTGLRFPDVRYRNVTLENITLVDRAATTLYAPVIFSGAADQSGIVVRNLTVVLNDWRGTRAGGDIIEHYIPGTDHHVLIDYRLKASGGDIRVAQTGSEGATLSVRPLGADVLAVSWFSSPHTTTCQAIGGWAGALPATGAMHVISAKGPHGMGLSCQGPGGSVTVPPAP